MISYGNTTQFYIFPKCAKCLKGVLDKGGIFMTSFFVIFLYITVVYT